MKKLMAAIGLVAALAPATSALASETWPIVDLRECPDGYVGRSV